MKPAVGAARTPQALGHQAVEEEHAKRTAHGHVRPPGSSVGHRRHSEVRAVALGVLDYLLCEGVLLDVRAANGVGVKHRPGAVRAVGGGELRPAPKRLAELPGRRDAVHAPMFATSRVTASLRGLYRAAARTQRLGDGEIATRRASPPPTSASGSRGGPPVGWLWSDDRWRRSRATTKRPRVTSCSRRILTASGKKFTFEPDLQAELGVTITTRPDYLVRRGSTRAVCEVKYFEETALDRRMRRQRTIAASDKETHGPIRNALREGAKNLRQLEGAGVPLVVVLTNPRGYFVDLDPWIIHGAILGTVGVVIDVNREPSAPLNERLRAGRDGGARPREGICQRGHGRVRVGRCRRPVPHRR